MMKGDRVLSILLVEDNGEKARRVAEFVRATISADSLNLVHVSDAATARRQMQAAAFDLVILDLVMPRIVGDLPCREACFELLDSLLDAPTMNVPEQVVGLTAYSDVARDEDERFRERAVSLIEYSATSDGWQVPLRNRIKQTMAAKRARTSAVRDFGSYLGIVCALDDEFEAVRQIGWGWADATVPGDPSHYMRGTLVDSGGTPRVVVATVCPRMGISAASIAASKLIAAFRPSFVGIVGIAAGIRERAQYGDVVAAEECWDWGLGKYERRDGVVAFSPAAHHLTLDAGVRGAIDRVRQSGDLLAGIRNGWPAQKPASMLSVVFGPVASGAAVIAVSDLAKQIGTQNRKLVGIEMEAYGVFAAAAEAIHPRPRAFSLKAISDFADEEKDDSYRHYACYTSAQVLRYLAEQHLHREI